MVNEAAPAFKAGRLACGSNGWRGFSGLLKTLEAGRAMLLKLYHILGLRALFPFHNFEFDFLTLLQGAKAFAGNVAVVDEDI
jgi:hypothetical protein